MYTTFKETAKDISEEEYRTDGMMHYSTLATYHREGFEGLKNLFVKKESPSLTLGSVVDILITGSMEEFMDKFIVKDFTPLSPAYAKVTELLYSKYGDTCKELFLIRDENIEEAAQLCEFYKTWRAATRIKVIKEQCSEYYHLLCDKGDKTLISRDTANTARDMVLALHTSDATKEYFEKDNPFDNSIERLYQMKYSSVFNDVGYSCMADLIYVDHVNKKVYPCDLKTTGHPEYLFYQSFITWCYHIQARLYWRIIRDNMDRHPLFKDYSLEDYIFIVINSTCKNPLTWKYSDTQKTGTLYYGKDGKTECRDPFDLGTELSEYIKTNPSVPAGISGTNPNDIVLWLNKN